MATRRTPPRAVASPGTTGLAPLGSALCLIIALGSGLGILVSRGRLHWPPTQLLASLSIIAGCLALVGPILLHRRGDGGVGLGELLWMAGGLLTWVFDGAAIARGEGKTLAWATPLGSQPMGLMILAVGLAAWRCRLGQPSWSWTNVTGWALGIFWVAMAVTTLLPVRTLGLAVR